MTKPDKPWVAQNVRADMTRLVLEKAKAALQDEETRKKLMASSMLIANQIRQLANYHMPNNASIAELSKVGEKFGQRRLESRVENLASTIDTLITGQRELTEALAPVSDAVAQIRVSVEIAGRLPFVKRQQAHHRLDRAIGRLESMLFEASLPSALGDDPPSG